MKLNKHSFPLIVILTVIVLILEAVTLSVLYTAAFEQQRAQLIATTKAQARLIESVAHFDQKFSANAIEGGADAATMSQIRNAHLNSTGFGKTGEFIFGKKENNKIIFLLPTRFKGVEEETKQKELLDVGGSYAEPMQLALTGQSGTIIANDYRGEKVLAAYEPIRKMNYGVVTKIDMKEIRAPFIRVGLISVAIAALLIAIGAFLFLRITQPIIKSLQDSERYNRMLFESSPIGLALTNMEGLLVDVNNAYANISGRGIEEVKQLSYWDITPDDYAEEEKRQLESLNTTGRYGPYEKEYFHKDGHRIPVRLIGHIIERDGEKFIWSSVEDISGQKKNEAAFIQSETRLNEAQRLAKVGSWELDLLSGELIWSNEIFNIFEIDKSKFEATYEAFLNAIHPDDRDSVNKAYSESLVDRKPYEISHRLQMSDGTIKNVHETCESYFDQDGKPIRSVGTVQDMTIQKLLESSIDKNRARFEAMFESMPDSVVLADIERNVALVNNSVEKLFGYTESELVGKDTSILYANHEDFLNAGKQRYSIDAEGDPLPYEIEYRKKDGTVFWGETLGTKIISTDGELYGFVGIIRDITERKKTEKELDQYAHQLEEKVDERTKELRDTQDELVRKERLATLGQLTATVSHELRNPLGAMRPSMYVIEKSSDKNDARVQKAIERVDRNIDRCDNIIDELLDYTRITKLNILPVRFDEWLETVIDEQTIPEDLHIEKDFGLKGLELHVDADRLRRAIINVFENASHSMMDDNQKIIKSKNARVTIKTREENARVEIIISDAGSGITKEVLEKIFEPLFSTKGFGVGLGMPTVKQIMEQHYGGVEIESEEGKGSEITLWLPLNK